MTEVNSIHANITRGKYVAVMRSTAQEIVTYIEKWLAAGKYLNDEDGFDRVDNMNRIVVSFNCNDILNKDTTEEEPKRSIHPLIMDFIVNRFDALGYDTVHTSGKLSLRFPEMDETLV